MRERKAFILDKKKKKCNSLVDKWTQLLKEKVRIKKKVSWKIVTERESSASKYSAYQPNDKSSDSDRH